MSNFPKTLIAFSKGRGGLPVALLICWLGAVEARTTFSVRADYSAVAGPRLEHSLTLVLSYFPGDGEAVLLTEIDFDPQLLAVAGATSTAGAAALHSGRIEIDYGSAPLAAVAEDTLRITATPEASLVLDMRTYSSLDGEAVPAHAIVFPLEVRSPVLVAVSARPTAVYPGIPFELAISIRNLDTEGRPLESLVWEWPEVVQVLDGAPEAELATPVEAGDSVAVTCDLQVRTGAVETVALKGMAGSASVYGSPLPAVHLDLLPVPEASAAFSGDHAVKGSSTELKFTWRNDSPTSIPVRELRAPVPDSFREIAIVDGSPAARAEVESTPSDQVTFPGWPSAWPHLVVRPESEELAPGGQVEVSLGLRPIRSGLFACESAFYPEAGGDPVPLSGDVVVRVVEEPPQIGEEAWGAGVETRTDLEAVQAALQARVRRELVDLPLAAGSRIELGAAEEDDRNWIAEDILTAELIRRGYRVAVKSPDSGGDSGAALSYRVVDARVVYSPQKGWNPMAAKRRREAIGDLFLSFENADRELSWIRRIRGYGVETVPSVGNQWLGGSETVDRVSVDPGNKAVEIGLSGLIVGGLFFVFFVP